MWLMTRSLFIGFLIHAQAIQALVDRRHDQKPLVRSEGASHYLRSIEPVEHTRSLMRAEEREISLLYDGEPAVWNMTGLPTTLLIQDQGSTISEDQWPADFCVDTRVQTPDDSDVSSPVKAIALIGGSSTSPSDDGMGRCGYFYICFISGNAPAMGVQCDGGGSDQPLGSSKNLTSFTEHDLRFCYATAAQQASMYVDGELVAEGTKNFVFPRDGQVTVFSGSHISAFEQTDGVKMTSMSISALPTTTSTTTTATTFTNTDIEEEYNNYQSTPFALQMMPRTVPAQRTATLTDKQWPPDFCVQAVVSTPLYNHGVRAIALLGGNGHCGNFMVFFAENNTIGMGVQCNLAGSDPELISAASVAQGTHALTFCYAKIEKKATISVDGRLITSDSKVWNFQNSGNVSILVGSHLNATEVLEGVTLQSLSIVSRNPEAPLQIPTDASGNQDHGVTVTLPPFVMNTASEKDRVNLTNFSWPGGSVTGANGSYGYRDDGTWGAIGPGTEGGDWVQSPDGSWHKLVEEQNETNVTTTTNVSTTTTTTSTTTTTTSTTTTTTTTTSIIVMHQEVVANQSSQSSNSVSHQRSADDTVTEDGSESHEYKHVEGR
jgi:hypothetical protein